MPVEIRVPTLPESVSEATVLDWHKGQGDVVRRDEVLVDVETEKVVLEVPAPRDGVLKEIACASGATVTEGELLAVIEEREAPAPAASEPAREAPVREAPAGDDPERHGPAVRALLAKHDVDPAAVERSGRNGRMTKEDVLRHLQSRDASGAPQSPPAKAREPVAEETTRAGAEGGRERREWREPMSRIRQTIASRLVMAQQTAAMLTTFNEADMSTVIDLRRRYGPTFEERHGVRLGFMSFFVKAAAEALSAFPQVNAYIDGSDVVRHDYADIGIAVSSPRGLLVPVVRDADLKSFAALEKEIADFGARAQQATITMDELNGGTFTITNGGIFGSLVSTPILNPPQSAILGMHKIQERPVALDGQVAIRPMMYLALSYDHRIIDGREAVQFLVGIKSAIEDPARLLFEL